MKSVAFFRNPWKKRSKDKNTTKGNQDVSATERVVLVPGSAPCTPTAMTFEIPDSRLSPSPNYRMRSQSQDTFAFQLSSAFARKAISPLSSASSTSSLVDQEITAYPSPFPRHHDIGHSPHSPAAWKPSHGLPRNAAHEPPNLNRRSPVSGVPPRSAGGAPVRPPRPPPLNLYPTTANRPVNTGLPPRSVGNRAITFALPPNPRVLKNTESASTTSSSLSNSPRLLRMSQSRSSEETARCAYGAVSTDSNHIHPHRGPLRDRYAAANLPLRSRHDPLPASSPRMAQVLELSDTPRPQRMYQSGLHTTSTPHLPSQDKQEVPAVPPLPFNSSNGQAGDLSGFPFSLFPPPPQSPLFIRRKIAKNLALRPSPTTPGAPLPPSPSLASPDHTPLVTPTLPRLQTSHNHSKSHPSFPRHPSSRAVPPPLFDPPSTPLPTPPTTPAIAAVRGGSPSLFSSKSLGSIGSTNQLHSEQLLPPVLPLTHRATSSEPTRLRDGTAAVNQARRRAQSRPEVIYQAYPFAGSHS